MEFKLINLIGSAISDFIDYMGFERFMVAVILIGFSIAIFAPAIARLIWNV